MAQSGGPQANPVDDKIRNIIRVVWNTGSPRPSKKNDVIMTAIVGRLDSLQEIRRILENHWPELKECSETRKLIFQFDMPDGSGGQQRTDIPEESWGLVREEISQLFVIVAAHRSAQSTNPGPPNRNPPGPSTPARVPSSKNRPRKRNDSSLRKQDYLPQKELSQSRKKLKRDTYSHFQGKNRAAKSVSRHVPLSCEQCNSAQISCSRTSNSSLICRPCMTKSISDCSLKPRDIKEVVKESRSKTRLTKSDRGSSFSSGTDSGVSETSEEDSDSDYEMY